MMTKIEENSLNAQNKLMSDIIRNFKSITYSVTQVGGKLRELLATKVIEEDNKTITLKKEVFDELLDLAYTLQSEKNWEKLGTLAESAVPDNIIKVEILNLLKQ